MKNNENRRPSPVLIPATRKIKKREEVLESRNPVGYVRSKIKKNKFP